MIKDNKNDQKDMRNKEKNKINNLEIDKKRKGNKEKK